VAGISSPNAREKGLPQFSDSSRAKASPRDSIASASRSSRRDRSAGVVSLQASKARCAADTALCTCSAEASGRATSNSPVAGFSTCSASPSPVTKAPSISNWVGSGVADGVSVMQYSCSVVQR